jgi:hypothetical protein
MKNMDYMRRDVDEGAEDFEYVDKKKEALGCLGVIGEEVLGCVFRLVIGGVMFGIIMLLVRACVN